MPRLFGHRDDELLLPPVDLEVPETDVVEALTASGAERRTMRTMTAAAQLIDTSDEQENARQARLHKKRPLQWQRDGWRYHDELGEVRTFGRFMGDTQSRVKMYPAILSDDPQQEPTPAEQAEGVSPSDVAIALECLERLKSDDGDRQELQRVFGLNLAIAGEVWLVGTENPEKGDADNPYGEEWRACSIEELKVTRDGQWAIAPWENARFDELEYLDRESTTLIRIYRRHGRWRSWPDSPMRAANIVCEELLLATQEIMGVLRSRIPAGILGIPDDIDEDDPEDDTELDDRADGIDPTLQKLIKHFSAPLSDPRSAAALVPYLMKLPTDAIDKIKLIELYKKIDPGQGARIELLIRRLAIDFDMPPESLTGTAGLNHWSAWLVGEDAVRNHVEPYTGLYTGPLTQMYLQPRLAAAGVANPERWVIRGDASEVIAHPDRKQNAQDGWDRLVLSDHTYVTALGFGEDDMPDEEEQARRLEQATQTGATPIGAGNVKQQPPPDSQQISTAGVSITPGHRMTPITRISEEWAAAQPAPLLASAAPRPSIGRRWARLEQQLTRDLLVASDAALRRMMERAQARIRTAANRDKEARATASSVPLDRLAIALGPDEVRRLGLNDDDLTAGGFASLAALYASLTGKTRDQAMAELERAGVTWDDHVASDYLASSDANRTEGWSKLEAALAGATLGLLFAATPPVPPHGEFDAALSVRPGDVRGALNMAGGGAAADAPETAGGMLAGADWQQFLDSTDNFERSGWVWEVGSPDRPFEPHQELDGVEFSSWFDEQLAAPADEFPYVATYAPQDHGGCQCAATPTGDVTVDDQPPEE